MTALKVLWVKAKRKPKTATAIAVSTVVEVAALGLTMFALGEGWIQDWPAPDNLFLLALSALLMVSSFSVVGIWIAILIGAVVFSVFDGIKSAVMPGRSKRRHARKALRTEVSTQREKIAEDSFVKAAEELLQARGVNSLTATVEAQALLDRLEAGPKRRFLRRRGAPVAHLELPQSPAAKEVTHTHASIPASLLETAV